MTRHHPPPPYIHGLHAPLDYVPTAPVYKPRRALRRSIYAGISAFVSLAIGLLLPLAVVVAIVLVGGWWAFCRFMARYYD